MINKIFVNLAVKDLDKSTAFFKVLRFSFNPQFTDKTAACMIIGDDIYSMLLTHEKFAAFTKPIADAHKSTEVLTALAVESKARVCDALPSPSRIRVTNALRACLMSAMLLHALNHSTTKLSKGWFGTPREPQLFPTTYLNPLAS